MRPVSRLTDATLLTSDTLTSDATKTGPRATASSRK